MYRPETYALYAPDTKTVLASHSIYFSALGEHGFVGLVLLMCLGLCVWRTGNRIVEDASASDQRWAAELARAIQMSLVGYALGGMFLGMLYFDLPYLLLAVLAVLSNLTRPEVRPWTEPARAT